MADILVTSPFHPFTLPTQFKAVFNGYIYCGTVDAVDPSVSQVQVYLVNESGDKVPVVQPLRTSAGGYLVYNGQPAKFVTDSNHSLLVQDSLHVQLWYEPNMSNIDPQSFMDALGGAGGAALVGDVSQVFATVAGMKSFAVVAGRIYQTEGYYTAGDGGDGLYYATTSGAVPDGYGDHTASNGIKLRLMSQPTDLRHGVKIGASFLAADAWNNRNALQAMLRNTRWSYFELVAKGTYYVLGSVHPLRSNIYINHKAGCDIIGRYNDASIPASLASQSGGMFGFVMYQNPDNGNFAVTGDILNVHYRLDGSVATEFNASHGQIHNNNCIGFYRVLDSSVRGVGGVNGSDHRGINFDGDAVNCHIDVGYAKGTQDEPLVMKASVAVGNLCTVKVGRVLAVPFGGPNAPIVIRAEGGAHDINIGSFVWDGVTKPQLVGAFNCSAVNLKAGYVNGASQLVRQLETLDVVAEVDTIVNTQYGIVRAGVATGRMRSASLKNVKAVDSGFQAAYRAESNQDTFASLEISNNNFSGGPSAFAYYNNKLNPGLPARLDIHDNISPAGITVAELNAYTRGITGNLVTPGVTTVAIDVKSPDWLYGVMTVFVLSGGNTYGIDIDLQTRFFTSGAVIYYAGPATLTTTRSGNTITLTVTTGTLSIVTMHN